MHKKSLASTSQSRHVADALLRELPHKKGLITHGFNSNPTGKSTLLQTVTSHDGGATIDFNRRSVARRIQRLRRVP